VGAKNLIRTAELGPFSEHDERNLAFTRVLQLLWLSRFNDSDLAIEVVMLRHDRGRPSSSGCTSDTAAKGPSALTGLSRYSPE
jgi:hypothetical protein